MLCLRSRLSFFHFRFAKCEFVNMCLSSFSPPWYHQILILCSLMFHIIVFWFVQVEILRTVHPDYASRVQDFLNKFNEEAEKVGHTPVLYFLTVSLYFRLLLFTCAKNKRCTVNSSFFVHFCPFQNTNVRVYTRPGASAMAASSKMWWIKNPTNGSLASEQKQMHSFPTATNIFNMKINFLALLNWTNLILSFFISISMWWC